jgi:uncharacterized Zn finger protein
MHSPDPHEPIKVICPACGTEDKRKRLILTVFTYGCKGCGKSFKHPLFLEREKRELKQN